MDFKCPKCGQLLIKNCKTCVGEIKCRRCKKVIKIKILSQEISCCNHH